MDKIGEPGGKEGSGKTYRFSRVREWTQGLVVTRRAHQPKSCLPNLDKNKRKDTFHLCSSGMKMSYFEPC